MNVNDFISTIKQFQNIIIYGAKARGLLLYTIIQKKLPYTDVIIAVTNLIGEREYVYDNIFGQIQPVYNISHCTLIADSSLVVIAALPKYHDEMETYAASLGFQNIVKISDEFFDSLYGLNSSPNSFYFQKSIFIQQQNANLIRLNNLSEQIRNGIKRKVKVLFAISSEAKFNFTSVYHAMKKRDLFDVYLFVYDDYYNSKLFNTDSLYSMKKYAEKLRTEGYNVIWGYDDKNLPVYIEDHEPDIIFYNVSYAGPTEEMHNLQKAISNHLSCFIPYDMRVKKLYNYHFNNDEIMSAWIYFMDTRPAYDMCINTSVTRGTNCVLSGWPLLDEYMSDGKPDKKDTPLRSIIYAPHWSLENVRNSTTFDKFSKHIFTMLESYQEFSFIFKPHPRLEVEIQSREKRYNKTKNISFNEYTEYCNKWQNAQNGEVVKDSSFIQRFRNAECLITDSYTFLLAWLPTRKPCIVLKNPEESEIFYDRFYDFIHPVLDSYYICQSIEELEEIFAEVIIDGNDTKLGARSEQCELLIHNLGSAGEYIANYVERKLRS